MNKSSHQKIKYIFWLGFFIGLAGGGVAVAFYLNNIHSSKVKALEDQIKGFTQGAVNVIKKV